MRELNGWTFDRDARGYWCVGGGERFGPYTTPQAMRNFAKHNVAPKVKPKRERPIVLTSDE